LARWIFGGSDEGGECRRGERDEGVEGTVRHRALDCRIIESSSPPFDRVPVSRSSLGGNLKVDGSARRRAEDL